MNDFGTTYKIQKGWQCPLCGIIHAPWVPSCHCQKVSEVRKSDKSEEYEPNTEIYRSQGYKEGM